MKVYPVPVQDGIVPQQEGRDAVRFTVDNARTELARHTARFDFGVGRRGGQGVQTNPHRLAAVKVTADRREPLSFPVMVDHDAADPSLDTRAQEAITFVVAVRVNALSGET